MASGVDDQYDYIWKGKTKTKNIQLPHDVSLSQCVLLLLCHVTIMYNLCGLGIHVYIHLWSVWLHLERSDGNIELFVHEDGNIELPISISIMCQCVLLVLLLLCHVTVCWG